MPAAQAWLVLALAAQAGLIFTLLFYSGGARYSAIKRGEVRMADIALGSWPPRLTQLGNAVNNQFQVPVLFFAAGLLALSTGAATMLFAILAWVFVATRLVHAMIFISSNRVSHRFFAFLVGMVICLVMWVLIVLRVLAVAG